MSLPKHLFSVGLWHPHLIPWHLLYVACLASFRVLQDLFALLISFPLTSPFMFHVFFGGDLPRWLVGVVSLRPVLSLCAEAALLLHQRQAAAAVSL